MYFSFVPYCKGMGGGDGVVSNKMHQGVKLSRFHELDVFFRNLEFTPSPTIKQKRVKIK